MATYRKTDKGALRILQNRISSKRTRRLQKIGRVQCRIDALKKKEEEGTSTATDGQDLIRQEFELRQAQADADQLKEELLAIAEKIKESKSSPEEPFDVGSTVQREPLDEYLQSLGMDPAAVDSQEVDISQF